MTMKTFSWLKDSISELSGEQLLLLCDPQTSGGLLIAVDPTEKNRIETILRENNYPSQSIGHLFERGLKTIFVND